MAKSQFDVINLALKERQSKIFRGSFVMLTQMTTSNTPVDKGSLKASWVFGVGAPVDEVRPSGFDALGAVRAEIKGFKIGMSAFMTNAQLYAIPIEFGSSQQAPNGLVRKYAAQWQQINDKVARAIK